MEKKRILVLTADVGFGHRSAANAIHQALRADFHSDCESVIVNPLEDKRTPFFLRDTGADYDRLVRNMPELYKFSYNASDTTVTSAIMESALILTLYEVMRDLLKKYQPDAIISTYPLYQVPLDAVMTLSGVNVPQLVAVTDLATVHRIWFSKSVDRVLVPNEIVQKLALGYGMREDQVMITGIPVNPQLGHSAESPAQVRRRLGWLEDPVTFLVVGSRRVEGLLNSLNVFNHFGGKLQLAVVAGNDAELYKKLRETEWHVPVQLYDFVRNIPELMHAADGVVCKAGGLIVTESLAAGKPIMLIDVLPGQETGNAELVVEGGAGDLANTDLEVLETLAHWLADDGKLMRERAENAMRMGKPRAAHDAAEQAVFFARRGPNPHKRLLSRRSLIDLFNRNQVRWGDSKESG